MSRHHHKYRLRRWYERIPLVTRATLAVGLGLIFILLLMLVWEQITGEWLLDTVMRMFR
jgi:hypothetical protein